MTKLRILALMVGMVVLFVIPAVVLAQVRPHIIQGNAMIDGEPAPDGTLVTAMIDGEEVGSAAVSNGRYSMIIDQGETGNYSGKTVTFQVGDYAVEATLIWKAGAGDPSFDLNGMTEGVAARVLPHVLQGDATIDGEPAPDGTMVTAMIDGEEVESDDVSNGRYSMLIDQGATGSFAGKTVTFQVGGYETGVTLMWTAGAGDPAFDLNGMTEGVMASEVTEPRLLFAEEIASGNLLRIFYFDNVTKEFSFFDPAFSDEANTLTSISQGQPLQIAVNAATTFRGVSLTPTWNIIAMP